MDCQDIPAAAECASSTIGIGTSELKCTYLPFWSIQESKTDEMRPPSVPICAATSQICTIHV